MVTNEQRPPPLGRHLAVLAFSALCFGFALYELVTVRFGSTFLVALYIAYVVSAAVFFHAVFFTINRIKRLTTSAPRYLEYAYSIVILASILQIFNAAPKISNYLSYMNWDEAAMQKAEKDVIADIRETAKRNVSNECITYGTRTVALWWIFFERTYHYTPEYCEQLKNIAEASQPEKYIEEHVINNKEFLEHPIEEREGADSSTEFTYSPIADLVENLLSLRRTAAYRRTFGVTPQTQLSLASTYDWIALIVFPIGVALRLVKTSLELWGRLRTPAASQSG